MKDLIQHKKYKNIIFDVGAVLVSWNPTSILDRTFSDAPHLMAKAHKLFFEDLYENSIFFQVDKGLKNYEEAEKFLAQDLGQFHAAKLLREGVNELAAIPAGISIFNEIKNLGYKTYILSNMSEAPLQRIASENDFVTRVDGAIWSYQVKAAKPEPEIYQILLKTYQLKAGECIFIDDREENIVAANANGIDGIVCRDHDYVRQELERLRII